MGKRGFSATTAILVAVLIGALYMVGRTVTPPPPGPPEPPAAAKSAADPHVPGMKGGKQPMSPMEQMKMMKQKQKQEMARHAHDKKTVKKFDPNVIEVVPGWTKEDGRAPGRAGELELQEKVKAAKAAQQAARQQPMPPTSASPQSASPPLTPLPVK